MARTVSYMDFKRYPFLVDLESALNKWYPGLRLSEVLERTIPILERGFDKIIQAIEKGRTSPPPKHITTENEVLAYHVALMIISFTANQWLINRFAEAESEYLYNNMISDDPEVLINIAKVLGVDIDYDVRRRVLIPLVKRKGKIAKKVLPFSISVTDYLRYTKRLRGDPSWSMSNQIIHDGRVYLEKDKIARILKEAIYARIKSSITPIQGKPPKLLEPYVNKVMDILKEKKRFVSEPVELVQDKSLPPDTMLDALPPCIKSIYTQAVQGEHLSHHARFALATFLLNIGFDTDYVLSVFRNMPDFNEKIARYQVEHLAGMRGSGKKYLPYNCDTMRTLGLCVAECKVKNPLTFYARKMRELRRQAEDKEKTIQTSQ